MADAVVARRPPERARWTEQDGLLAAAVDLCARRTSGDPGQRAYAAGSIGRLVDAEGRVAGWDPDDGDLRNLQPGVVVAMLLEQTGEERYRRAMRLLLGRLRRQPRTRAGGFWSSRTRPFQMWLDALSAPFHARCAAALGEEPALEDAVHQLLLAGESTHDPRVGLPCHAWDESRRQLWSNPESGRSPVIWARAVGSFAVAATDTYAELPPAHRGRGQLADMIGELARSIMRWQDPATGVWWQVMDQPGRDGNWPEAAASCLLARTLAAAARHAAVPGAAAAARRAWDGIVARFLGADADARPVLHGCTPPVELGGSPYRDGSFSCYADAPALDDEPTGTAAFITASLEIDTPDLR
jgi:unsaturated rhamnogalacturonyl hydrolase